MAMSYIKYKKWDYIRIPMTDPWCWYIYANMNGDILMGSMAHHI